MTLKQKIKALRDYTYNEVKYEQTMINKRIKEHDLLGEAYHRGYENACYDIMQKLDGILKDYKL